MIDQLNDPVQIQRVGDIERDEIGGVKPPTYTTVRTIWAQIKRKSPAQNYEAGQHLHKTTVEVVAREDEVEELLFNLGRFRLLHEETGVYFQPLGFRMYDNRSQFVKLIATQTETG